MMEHILFSPFKIKNMELRNRFIMLAAADYLDHNLQKRTERFVNLAKGKIGLVVSGGTRLANLESFEDSIKAMHKEGGKYCIQIVSKRGPGVYSWSTETVDELAVSTLPENHPYFSSKVAYGKHHEATEEEIVEIIKTYADTAKKAQEINADAIQIHAAHNNILAQFLSPLMNKRKDRWGGSLENRTRLHCKIIKAIRQAVGEDFPVLIKLGVEDAFNDGLKFEEGKKAAQIVSNAGYDALEISQGLMNFNKEVFVGTPMRMGPKTVSQEGYFRHWTKEIKQLIVKPVIMTGGLRSYEACEKIIAQNEADLIGMCRPFIREPHLIARWQQGDRQKATCVSCNQCIMAGTDRNIVTSQGLQCVLDMKK